MHCRTSARKVRVIITIDKCLQKGKEEVTVIEGLQIGVMLNELNKIKNCE